jgi:hypothetical protein
MNETSSGQTSEQGSSAIGGQTSQQELTGGQNENQQPAGADNGVQEIPKSQSDFVMQSMQDDRLVERIFPLILQKMDSETILKKIDPVQLFNKLIIPHLRVSLTGDRQVNSGFGEKAGNGLTILSVQTPSCYDPNADPQDRKLATAGGAQIDVNPRFARAIIVNGVPDDRLVGSRPGDLPNTWRAQAIIEGHDRLTTYVDCRGIQVAYVP